jgi:O-acetyl-ADP-ribose deacetylase
VTPQKDEVPASDDDRELPSIKIAVLRGDITAMEVDAIVNAANTTLLGGGGVDGAIHRAAGPELLSECRVLNGCRPGQAKLTRGYNLPARFVIHTVGPIWRGGKRGEARILASCYRNSLQIAIENEIATIAFPAISCGAYGYPIEQAADIALRTTASCLARNGQIREVAFVLWDEDVYHTFVSRWKRWLESAKRMQLNKSPDSALEKRNSALGYDRILYESE